MSRPCTQDSRAPGGPRSGPGGASCSLTRAGSEGGSKARDTNSTTACPGASLTLGGGSQRGQLPPNVTGQRQGRATKPRTGLVRWPGGLAGAACRRVCAVKARALLPRKRTTRAPEGWPARRQGLPAAWAGDAGWPVLSCGSRATEVGGAGGLPGAAAARRVRGGAAAFLRRDPFPPP